MIDRTDLQLMLIEQIVELDTDCLIDLFQQLTGHEMDICDETTEEMIGSLLAIEVADSAKLKKMLGFFLYALGERVEIPVEG